MSSLCEVKTNVNINHKTTHKSTIFTGYNTPFSIRASSVFASSGRAKEKVTTSREEEETFLGLGHFHRKKNAALLEHRTVFLVYVYLDITIVVS